MGADDQAGAAPVAEMPHAHLLGGGLGMKVDQHRIAGTPSGQASSSRDTAGKGSSSTGSIITRPMAFITSTRLPLAVSTKAVPRPGQPRASSGDAADWDSAR